MNNPELSRDLECFWCVGWFSSLLTLHSTGRISSKTGVCQKSRAVFARGANAILAVSMAVCRAGASASAFGRIGGSDLATKRAETSLRVACVTMKHITYLPRKAVAEVSKDKEPIGRECAEFNWFESQLMSD